MDQHLKGYLSVILTTFGSSVLAYISTAMVGGFSSTMQWQAVLFAAFTTGLASVYHLFQAKPGTTAPEINISDVVAAVLAEISKKPVAPTVATFNITNNEDPSRIAKKVQENIKNNVMTAFNAQDSK